jgi:hypothetical protein
VADAKKARRNALYLQAQLQLEMDAADALAQENGQSLLDMHIMLEALGRNKQVLSIHVLETVFVQLGGIESAPAANRAVDQIRGFLYTTHARIEDCLRAALIDGAAVRELIQDIEKIVPLEDDVGRLISSELPTEKGLAHSLLVLSLLLTLSHTEETDKCQQSGDVIR